MRRLALLALVVLVIAGGVVYGPRLFAQFRPAPKPTQVPYQAGFNVLFYRGDANYSSDFSQVAGALAADHVNSVAIVFPIYQADVTATNLHRGAGTPTDDELKNVIGVAHSKGLKVMLRPLLDDRSLMASGQWRGVIKPSSPAAWFSSYSNLIVDYARLAAVANVEIFDLGTEFVSLESHTDKWLAMIKRVRALYSGVVTYSFNHHVGGSFWSALDVAGIDAYPALDLPKNVAVPDETVLATAWQSYLSADQQLLRGKPLMLTEVGLFPVAAAIRQPWLWNVRGAKDYGAQKLYYSAACHGSKSVGAKGIYWWDVVLGGEVNDFDPRGHPAESAVRDCFASVPQ